MNIVRMELYDPFKEMEKIYKLPLNTGGIYPRIKHIIEYAESEIASDQELFLDYDKTFKRFRPRKNVTPRYRELYKDIKGERDFYKSEVDIQTERLDKFKDYVFNNFKYIDN